MKARGLPPSATCAPCGEGARPHLLMLPLLLLLRRQQRGACCSRSRRCRRRQSSTGLEGVAAAAGRLLPRRRWRRPLSRPSPSPWRAGWGEVSAESGRERKRERERAAGSCERETALYFSENLTRIDLGRRRRRRFFLTAGESGIGGNDFTEIQRFSSTSFVPLAAGK